MLMADTMSIFFVIVGLMLAFSGLWLLCRGLWAKRVEAAADWCGNSLWKPFLAGIPLSLVIFLLIISLIKLFGSLGNAMAIGLFCGYFLFASIGVAGLATSIGHKLSSEIDLKQPWRTTLRGAVILVLSFLTPLLGWFILFPFSLVIGCGAITLSFFKFKLIRQIQTPDNFQSNLLSTLAPANAQTATMAGSSAIGAPQ